MVENSWTLFVFILNENEKEFYFLLFFYIWYKIFKNFIAASKGIAFMLILFKLLPIWIIAFLLLFALISLLGFSKLLIQHVNIASDFISLLFALSSLYQTVHP